MVKSRIQLVTFMILVCSAFGHGVSEADKSDMIGGSLADYLYLGAKHMVTGYDHILFLVGVLFFLKQFSDIVKFITAFTFGHCITLIGATVLGFSANYYLIDAVIALSVIYKGFENLDGFKKCLNRNAPNLVAMVFVFGLIHGFGLSTRLQQIALGNEHVILKIVSFNVGVEIGQIAVLAIIYPGILFLRRDSFGTVSKMTNSILIIAGAGLFCYQINGYFSTSHTETHAPVEKLGHDHDHGGEDHHIHDLGAGGIEEPPHRDRHEEHDHGKAHDIQPESRHHTQENVHSHDHQRESFHHSDHSSPKNGKLHEDHGPSPHRPHGDGFHDHGNHQHDH